MRERIRDIERLRHIDECIDNVVAFLEGKTFEALETDKMCFHAVVYNIMIIGEAANMLTKEFREKHTEVADGNHLEGHNPTQIFGMKWLSGCTVVDGCHRMFVAHTNTQDGQNGRVMICTYSFDKVHPTIFCSNKLLLNWALRNERGISL